MDSESLTPRLLIITGLSGAGRSTCLKVFEDLNFEAVDNLPLNLLRRALSAKDGPERDLAVGMDSRTSGFEPSAIQELLASLARRKDIDARLIFCDCADEVIQQRYSETRRPHPMSPDRRVADGIAKEHLLMAPLKESADIVLDTTETTTRQLRERLLGMFSPAGDMPLAITVMSFAYRHGVPRDADVVMDVRFLRNPHYDKSLKHSTGLDQAVGRYIQEDPEFGQFTTNLLTLLVPLLPRYRAEGKSYLTIAFGCTGGQHRSVFMAEWLSSRLSDAGWTAKILHREVEAKRISAEPQP